MRNDKMPMLLAAKNLKVFGAMGAANIVAAATENDLPTYSMEVYSGGEMVVGYYGRTVIDLDGLKIAKAAMPALKDHDTSQIVGHGKAVIEGGKVLTEGIISGTGPAAVEVVGSAKNGFPWKSSIGVQPERWEYVEAGKKVKVNGRTFQGPIRVLRAGEMIEHSFVWRGADKKANSKIAAEAASFGKENAMPPEFIEFLKARGKDPEQMEEEEVNTLLAAWESGRKQVKNDPEPEPKKPVTAKEDDGHDPKVLAAEAVKAERERTAGIRAACAGFTNLSDEDMKKVKDVEAKALDSEDTVEAVNAKLIEIVQQARPKQHVTVNAGEDMNADTLQAAILMQTGMGEKELKAHFKDETLEAAAPHRALALSEMVEYVAAMNGHSLPNVSRRSGEWIRAAFSTVGLSGILGNAANKSMLSAYRAVPSAVRQVFSSASLNDFKQHTRYRLTGDYTFRKVGADGELQHAVPGEQSFTNQADTHGRIFQLTRQDMVNDDLGAFMEIPRLLGRGAALSLEETGMKLLLSNPSSFFSSDNGNLLEGTAYNLGGNDDIEALAQAEKLLLEQTDADGNPVLLDGAFLLCPPGKKSHADALYRSTQVVIGGGTTTKTRAVENVYANKFLPIYSPYLSNTGFTGYSTTAWYLFADPANVAAFEVGYLNGVDTPTVEEVQLPAEVLGVGFRGYMDYGMKEQDYRAAVKVTGVAAAS